MIVDVYYRLGFSSWLFILSDTVNTGSCEWNTYAFEDGTYAIKVEITDEHGGTHMSDVIEDIEIFNADAPELDVDEPIDGQTVTGNLLVQWSVMDPDTGETVSLSALYSIDGEVWTKIADGLSGAGYSWDTTTVDDGEYDLKIIASDGVLETEYIVYGIIVNNYINHLPTASIDHPGLMDSLKDVATITWTAQDDNMDDI
jgi:hypothetical protein